MKARTRTIRRCSLLVDLQSRGGARVRPLGGMEQLEARTVLSGFGGPMEHHDHFVFEYARPAYHEIIVAEGEYAPRLGGDFGPSGPMLLDRGRRGAGPEGGQRLGSGGMRNEPPTTFEAHPRTAGPHLTTAAARLAPVPDRTP